jgi:hypothetical protein
MFLGNLIHIISNNYQLDDEYFRQKICLSICMGIFVNKRIKLRIIGFIGNESTGLELNL